MPENTTREQDRQIENARKGLESLEDIINSLDTQLSELREEKDNKISELEYRIEKLESENYRLTEQLDDIREQLINVNHE